MSFPAFMIFRIALFMANMLKKHPEWIFDEVVWRYSLPQSFNCMWNIFLLR